MELITYNPSTGEVLKKYTQIDDNELELKLSNSKKSFQDWSKTTFEFRASILHNVAAILEKNKKQYAELMALEMGKPIAEGISEIEKCAFVCNYYADNAELMLKPTHIDLNFSESYIAYKPLGTILAIMPWNFPFWQVFRCAAPTLMAGNCCVLKHSNNTTGSAIAIEEIFKEAGVPEGVFYSLIIDVDRVEKVISHSAVQGISFTGSTRVGKIVASQAGLAMKKCVFELGGSDPYVILDDADLDYAADIVVNGRYYNAGQTCISPKRAIITKKNEKHFIDLILAKAQKWTADNPLKQTPNAIGPLARKDLLNGFSDQVEKSITLGAKCIIGGKKIDSNGNYYLPTVLIDVKKGMPAYDEELFGPAISIITAKDEDEALIIANDTEFGLGGAVFTNDIEKGKYIAENILQCGAACVNTLVKSDPRLPFGGVKNSGYGREIGLIGLQEFVNIKIINIQ